jgi:hypothetical protein
MRDKQELLRHVRNVVQCDDYSSICKPPHFPSGPCPVLSPPKGRMISSDLVPPLHRRTPLAIRESRKDSDA